MRRYPYSSYLWPEVASTTTREQAKPTARETSRRIVSPPPVEQSDRRRNLLPTKATTKSTMILTAAARRLSKQTINTLVTASAYASTPSLIAMMSKQMSFSRLCRSVLASTTLSGARVHQHVRTQGAAFVSYRPPFATASLKTYLGPLTTSRFMSTAVKEEVEEDWPRFEDKINLHPNSKKAVKKMGLTTMTEIQAKTFDAAASGQDVLARARTGTGKTVAFLLPCLERILENPIEGQVNALILCPTRELASQIADQTRQLTSAHSGISYQVMFGGASRKMDIDRLEKRVPTILVATPGRIQDHFDNTFVRDKRFSTLFHRTQVLVLDEMDRLLDMGFRNDVEKIITYLPLKRQTLLFSATLPPGVKHLIKRNMSDDFVTVDCIHDADPTTHTNDLVQQSHVIVKNDNLVLATVGILLNILQDPNAKVIAFFPTTKMVRYYAELFNDGLGRTVMELHSGKSQSYRTSASNRFRELNKGVLFTSDVSARGVDYKDVSHVLQVGMADSRETYIHRLGRTARAGKKGQGILILAEIEKGFLRMLQGLDVDVDEEMKQIADNPPSSEVMAELGPVLESIRTGRNQSLTKSAKDSYRGMLGYYRGQLKRVGVSSPEHIVQFVNGYSVQSGLCEVPSISAKSARNMGIYGISGLTYTPEEKRGSAGGRGKEASGNKFSNKKRSGGSSRRSSNSDSHGQSSSGGRKGWWD